MSYTKSGDDASRQVDLVLVGMTVFLLITGCFCIIFSNDLRLQLGIALAIALMRPVALGMIALTCIMFGIKQALSRNYIGTSGWIIVSVWTLIVAFSDGEIFKITLACAILGAVRSFLVFRRRMYLSTIVWAVISSCTMLVGVSHQALGDWAYYLLNKSVYEKVLAEVGKGVCQVNRLSPPYPGIEAFRCADPTVILFLWTSDGPTWSGVVFDSDDKIIKPGDGRWRELKDAEGAVLLSCSEVTRSFGDHYYRLHGWYNVPENPC